MKIVTASNGKKTLVISKTDWENIGRQQGWIIEAKKKRKSPKYEHSPKKHGFIDECIEKNPQVDDPGAYCASIVDKAKGTTKWRKGPQN